MNRERALQLHSRYNPRKEAERYIESLSLDGDLRFLILVEPGLGYLVAPLKKKFPSAKIISLHAADDFLSSNDETDTTARPDSEWMPSLGISVQDFLEREIPDTYASEIRIIEWRPAMNVYGQSYVSLIEEAAEFIKRADANFRTLTNFGRRWFKNFFKNIKYIHEVVRHFSPFGTPVFIAGAGPGLEEVIPLVRKEAENNNVFVLAVSSAVPALLSGGVSPDMVISTDGGGWAKFHLYETCRETNHLQKKIIPLAAAMTSALPSQCGTVPVLPISDGSLWQTFVLKELSIPFITLPSRGTVSASALDLSFALTSGDIYIAGMDLSNRDMRTHARPYSFDRFMEEKSSRLNPFYSQAFQRSSALRDGGSYGIYAAWFEKQLSSYPKRLHSLGRNNNIFDSLETFSFKGKNSGEKSINFSFLPVNIESVMAEKTLFILENILKNNDEYSSALNKEISALLFPGVIPGRNELLDTVKSLLLYK